jgi:predicted component of type VI protein secretion system
VFGRLGPMAERHARDFETLLAKVEAGEVVETGAARFEDPGELEHLQHFAAPNASRALPPCPSGLSDAEHKQTRGGDAKHKTSNRDIPKD